MCRVSGVLDHLAPVHRCARSVLCFARAVSWATWLLFTGVPAWFVVSRVQYPGCLGSCSPVCPLSVLCCVYGVPSPLALVNRLDRSVRCLGCALSWAFWLLFTGVLAQCSALWVACAGRRCGALTCPTGQRLFVAGRGWVRCRARTRPSGRRLYVAGRGWVPSGHALVRPDGSCSVAGCGWVRCRARTRPSGRRLLLGTCSRAVVCCVLCALSGFAAPGGCCCLAPVCVPWSWPAACLSGVPPGPAWCAAPPPVRSLSVLRLSFLTPSCLSPPQGLAAPALLGRCAGHAEAGRDPGSLCPPLAPAEAGALGSLRVVPVPPPQWGCPWRVPLASVLGCVPCGDWRVWTWLLTRPVSRTVRRATQDSAGAPELFRVDTDNSPSGSEDATPRSRACVRALFRPGRVGRAGLPGSFWCAPPFPLAALSFCFARPPTGWGCPLLGPFFALPSFPPVFPPPSLFLFFLFFFFRAPPLSLAFFCFWRQVPWALALCFSFSPPPGLWFRIFSSFCVCPLCLWFSLVSGPGYPGTWRCVLFVLLASRFPALCALSPNLCFSPRRWLLPGRCCLPPPFLCLAVFVAAARCFVFLFFFSLSCVVRPHCLWLSLVSGHECSGLWRCVLFVSLAYRFSAPCALSPHLCLPPGRWLIPGGCCAPPPLVSGGFRRCCPVLVLFSFCFLFFCAPPLSLAFSGFRPRGPWALALCVVCFVGLPLLGSPCAVAGFVFPAWPFAAPWWLLPPPPLLCLAVFLAAAQCSVFISAALLLPACLALAGSSRRLLPPSLPSPRCVRGALCCLLLPRCAALSVGCFAVRCCRVPRCVLCSGPLPCCVVGCCVLWGYCWGVCLCVVLRCCLLLRVVPCLWSCRPVGSFAVWLAVWLWSVLPCAMLCCVSLGAVLRRAAARCGTWCCAVVCCVVLLRSFGAAACCAVLSGAARRPGDLCLAGLCFAVFPRAV